MYYFYTNKKTTTTNNISFFFQLNNHHQQQQLHCDNGEARPGLTKIHTHIYIYIYIYTKLTLFFLIFFFLFSFNSQRNVWTKTLQIHTSSFICLIIKKENNRIRIVIQNLFSFVLFKCLFDRNTLLFQQQQQI